MNSKWCVSAAALCALTAGLPAHGQLTIQFGGDAAIVSDTSYQSQIGASQVIQWNGVNSAGGSFGASGSLTGPSGVVGGSLTSLGSENLVLTTRAIGSTVASPMTVSSNTPNILGVNNPRFDVVDSDSWSFDFNQDVVLKQLVFAALDFNGETIELGLEGGDTLSFNRQDTQMAGVTYANPPGTTANRFVYSLADGGAVVSAGQDITLASTQGSWGLQGIVAQLTSPVTTLVGGSTNNGDFNADTGGSSPAFELNFTNTTAWTNVGNSGSQANRATRNNAPQLDGTRNAIFDDDTQIVHAVDTGHVIAEGDVYNLSYFWTDGPSFANWDDAADQVRVRLYTTSDDTINNPVKNIVAESVSELSAFNNFYQREIVTALHTADASAAGRRLFVNFTGLDGNDASAPNGVGRLDNFELSVGTTDGAAAPSDPTGVVLFRDTFDRPDTIGLSADAVTTGMSSDVFTPTAGDTYAEFRNRDTNPAEIRISGNKLQMGPTADANAGIDRNFVDPEILASGGFAVEVVVDPKTGSNSDATNRYATIGVGLNQANATVQLPSTNGEGPDLFLSDGDVQVPEQAAFAFLVYDDGTYGFFDSFALTDESSGNPPTDLNRDIFGVEYTTEAVDGKQDFLAQLGQVAVLQDEYKVRLEYEVTDFDSGSDVVVTAFIDDIQIDLDTSDGVETNPEDRDSYTFTWDSDSQNYIALNGRAQSTVSFDNLLIETFELASLPGDYNGDGAVDAADYTVWRDGLSPDSSISGYTLWRENFGATLPAASGAGSVPEPASVAVLACLVAAAAGATRHRRADR
ncbi:MAG: hypothetical protein AAGJ46_15345 [Planctomycetota bacterium]